MVEAIAKFKMIKFHTGNFIPQIGYGTYELKGADCLNGVKIALQAGYKHIDTASIYKNEEIIQQALEQYQNENTQSFKREDLFITSKVNPSEQGYENCKTAVANILQRLKIDYIDLILIHWPAVAKTQPGDAKNAKTRLQTWKALEELKDQGKIKDIGVSNFLQSHLEHLIQNSKYKPVINQFELHPLLTQKSLVEYCRKNEILIEAYSPLARQNTQLMENAYLVNLAKNKQKTVAQICLIWALQQDFVIIPKSKTEQYIKDNFNILDVQLSEQEIKEIDKLNINLHTCWNPKDIK